MPRLPNTIDFNADDYPELSDIFRGIDAGIAAIVAADPTLRPNPAHKRRKRASATPAPVRRGRVARKAAA